MATNRISVLIDVVTDKATRGIQGFKTAVSDADGAVGKFKAGSASAFASLKANALPVAAAVGAGLVAIGSKAVSAASRLEESMNAVNVSFGEAAEGVHELGEDSVESFGLSQAAFNEAAVSMSAFAKTIAGEGGDVAGTLEDLVGRATDFASVFNIDVEEALRLFQSGLAGETEPLRKFGKDLSAASVEAYALEKGIVASKDELDESAKVTARYGLLMEQTADTAGDFANTQDSLANSTKTLDAQMENLYAELGERLTPVVAEAVQVINDLMTISEGAAGAANTFGLDLGDVGGAALDAINPLGMYSDMVRDTAREAFGSSEANGELEDQLYDTGRAMVQSSIDSALLAEKLKRQQDADEDAADAAERSADVTRNAARAARDRREAVDEMRESLVESFNSDIAYRDSVADTTDAVDDMTVALNDSEASAADQEQAVRDAESAILDQADAAVQLAVDQAEANGKTLDAKQKTDVYRQELGRLSGFLAPGSELRGRVQGYINQLDSVPRSINTTVNFRPGEGFRAAGVPINVGATGGIVTQPTMALIGEAGPEAVVPLDRAPGASPLPGGDLGGSAQPVNITVNALDPQAASRAVIDAIKAYERRNGASWRGVS